MTAAEVAADVRVTLPQAPRPWRPWVMVERPGFLERVPECFGRCGYGQWRCQRFQCEYMDACYQTLRAVVEQTDARAVEFNDRHRELIGELGAQGVGDPGLAAMRIMVQEGAVRPFEEAYKANDLLGRLDSGEWAPCAGCDRVARKDVLRGGRCPRCVDAIAEQAG